MKVKVEVNQSLYRHIGFQEGEAPRFLENRPINVVRLSALGTGCLYSQEIFLRGWFEATTILRLEGLCSWTIPRLNWRPIIHASGFRKYSCIKIEERGISEDAPLFEQRTSSSRKDGAQDSFVTLTHQSASVISQKILKSAVPYIVSFRINLFKPTGYVMHQQV